MANRNSRKSGKNRREQTYKGSRENKALMRAMQGIRSSGAAGPHADRRDRRGQRDNLWKGDF